MIVYSLSPYWNSTLIQNCSKNAYSEKENISFLKRDPSFLKEMSLLHISSPIQKRSLSKADLLLRIEQNWAVRWYKRKKEQKRRNGLLKVGQTSNKWILSVSEHCYAKTNQLLSSQCKSRNLEQGLIQRFIDMVGKCILIDWLTWIDISLYPLLSL